MTQLTSGLSRSVPTTKIRRGKLINSLISHDKKTNNNNQIIEKDPSYSEDFESRRSLDSPQSTKKKVEDLSPKVEENQKKDSTKKDIYRKISEKEDLKKDPQFDRFSNKDKDKFS